MWAIELADTLPDTTVVGTDLSPIQPGWVPPNCSFFVDDAEEIPWEFEAPFDVIHLRNMEAAFADWPKVYKQIFENLRPGGMLEHQSQECWIYSLDKEVPHSIMEWQTLLVGASKSFGRDMGLSKQHKRFFEEAGFQDIEEVAIKIPLGPWAKQDKPLGEVNLACALDAMEAYTLTLFTQELAMSVS